MTSESKILTVSYGTFSCTLEGFDNPFDTMKVIAEYFRDLAAHDRYFGAEPPQPDAAMLHRVTEREVARLVERRLAEDGVEDPDAVQSDSGSGADASDLVFNSAQPSEAEPQFAPEVAPVEPDAVPKPAEPSLQDEVPRGFSAKLARIRASTNPATVAPPLPDDQLQAFMPTPSGDAGATDAPGQLGNFALSPDPTSADADEAAQPLEEPSVAPDASAPMANVADLDATSVEAVDAGPDGITAIAAQTDAEPEPVSDAGTDDAAGHIAEELSADTALLDTEPETAAILGGPVYYRFDDDGDPSSGPDPVDLHVAEAQSPEVPDPELETAEKTPTAVFADDRSEDAFDEHLSQEAREAELDAGADPVSPASDIFEGSADDSVVADANPEDAGEGEPPVSGKNGGRYERISSRVVRIRAEDGDATETPAPEPEEVSDPNATRIVQSAEMDAEMSRLLRQAEDVMSEDENRRRLDAIAMLKASIGETESDLGPPSEPRKTEDDRQDPYRVDLAKVVEPMPAPEPETPKPTRRKSRSVRVPDSRPGTIRPNAFGPPPLVLVTEQRVDRPPPSLTAPPAMTEPDPAPASREGQPILALRTGRLTGAIGVGSAAPLSIAPHQRIVLEQPYVAGQPDSDEDEDLDEALPAEIESGLVSFAEQLGLTSTVELLEAAAAFTTCVEDRGQFTRPQLMRRLMASAERGSISREDGLRSFGTLLRTGRIEKIGRGSYSLSQNSPYMNEARRFS